MRTGLIGPTLKRLLFMSLLIPAAGATAAEDSLDTLAQELIELRGEVQSLNTELQDAKDQHRSRMSSLEQQRGELQAERNRVQLRMKKLEENLAETREQARQAGVGSEELRPVVLEALDQRRRQIGAEIPFKVDERLAELDDIERQLKTGVLTPHKAANRLWSFYEDELGLASENGIYRQTIELDGEERLTDVARLGTVMMFFRTSEGRYGHAVNEGADGWRYDYIDDAEAEDRVAGLFDAMEKQIRTGYFTLPNALVEKGSR
ncbi:DUF3450 family protein [Ectothiorhodospiraceae bacterium WFHF3C12]|nr:DUF3450 family protein [Ectothiorhodospiraceae bacterium WFHF3C12]